MDEQHRAVNFLPGDQRIVDYFETKKATRSGAGRDQGVGAVPKEQYRLFWDGIMNWSKIGWLADKFADYDACVVSGRYTHMASGMSPRSSTSAIPLTAWRRISDLPDQHSRAAA